MGLDPKLEQSEQTILGRWWQKEKEAFRCMVCPRYCLIKPGKRGFCYVRAAGDDGIYLTTYGRSSGFCIDPIEKKPLNHFYPGTPVLTFGTAGCNLGCKFCQNWDISKARSWDRLGSAASPEKIATLAKSHGCHSIAFSYNDPVIFAEYAIDCAKSAHQHGLYTVAVSAGYMGEEARTDFYQHIDAVNIDLKSFSESFYKRLCLGHLQPVLDTLVYLVQKTQVWVEITTLIIPEENDSPEEIRALCEWIITNLGPDIPLHFTAFHPDYKMVKTRQTSAWALQTARQYAIDAGLNYVYIGNVHDSNGSSTYCPQCKQKVIERDWYMLGPSGLHINKCSQCGETIKGHFTENLGNWGAKRKQISV
ncbi:MAG: AmmeMemoRadiSam system radical SAM enzyme [Zetaproteobacteria bacterium]|nr:AmmeMemoRadiSam system radical SAM enzyme [Pseudobdellovibrionaceae bacterium]